MKNTIQADNRAIEIVTDLREANLHIKKWELFREPLKLELMKTYFSHAETLLDFENRPIATAKLESRRVFQSDQFKQDYPELYAQYTKEITTQPLRIK